MTIVAVGGRPGSGKTSLMRLFMSNYCWIVVTPLPLLKCHYCEALNLYVLGLYELKTFDGTDRLPMNVAPTAETFVSQTGAHVLYEGDRLFTQKFLNHCYTVTDDVHIVCLEASEHIIENRYKIRGSAQSETFLKGRKTKLERIQKTFPTVTLTNNTPEQQMRNLEYITSLYKKQI